MFVNTLNVLAASRSIFHLVSIFMLIKTDVINLSSVSCMHRGVYFRFACLFSLQVLFFFSLNVPSSFRYRFSVTLWVNVSVFTDFISMISGFIKDPSIQFSGRYNDLK